MTEKLDFGYGTKATLIQCLVLTTTYFLNVQQGINMMMPTVIIGALKNNKTSEDSFIPITTEESSWIGSLVYITPPLGSLFLSLVQTWLGHRMCMALTNIVQLSPALIVMTLPITVNVLYACSMLMGLSTGLATGLCISYSGEVCEPKLRGSLTSALNVFYFGGYFLVATLYAITKNWKKTLLFAISVPMLNFLALVMTPDSPMWLLSKGKTAQAKMVLKKLRGCSTDEKCAVEFQEMVQYVSLAATKSEEAKHISSKSDRFSYPGMWKPLKLMLIYIFFSNILCGVPYTPNLEDVIKEINPMVDSSWTMSVYTAFSTIGNIFTVLLVNRLGKRPLLFFTIIVCSLSYLFIGFIGFFLTSNVFNDWVKLVLFIVSVFFSSLGVMPIGWILMSEVFPMKSKNLGCSIGAGSYFFLSFFMAKYNPYLQNAITLYGTFVLFGLMGIASLMYFYSRVPNTENKTLKEINEHFNKKSGVI